jgi:hypothetical protein
MELFQGDTDQQNRQRDRGASGVPSGACEGEGHATHPSQTSKEAAMTFDNYVKGQLLGLAIREGARHGGVNNTLAIAQVIANRVRAGWHGGDWLKVISDAPRVSGTIYDGFAEIDPRDVNFRLALQKMDDVYAGGIANEAMTALSVRRDPEKPRIQALYYGELDHINNVWFTSILRNPAAHPRITNIGPVTFFG